MSQSPPQMEEEAPSRPATADSAGTDEETQHVQPESPTTATQPPRSRNYHSFGNIRLPAGMQPNPLGGMPSVSNHAVTPVDQGHPVTATAPGLPRYATVAATPSVFAPFNPHSHQAHPMQAAMPGSHGLSGQQHHAPTTAPFPNGPVAPGQQAYQHVSQGPTGGNPGLMQQPQQLQHLQHPYQLQRPQTTQYGAHTAPASPRPMEWGQSTYGHQSSNGGTMTGFPGPCHDPMNTQEPMVTLVQAAPLQAHASKTPEPSAPVFRPAHTHGQPQGLQTTQTRGGNSFADVMFESSFTTGWARVKVSGDELLCGLRAVHESLWHQVNLKASVYELLLIHHSDEAQEENRKLGRLQFNNNDDFGVDQLATILNVWGRRHGHNLRLGFRLQSGQCNFADFVDQEPDADIVWIWSSNLTGVTGEDDVDHYNGIRPVG